MKTAEKQRLRDEARANLKKFWDEQVEPLLEAARATLDSLHRAYEEKHGAFIRTVSSLLGLEVDSVWMDYAPPGMPAGRYLGCEAVADRDSQETIPGLTPFWKYRKVRYVPCDAKLANFVRRGNAELYREHMAATVWGNGPYFDRVAEAWQGIGADDYLAKRLKVMHSFDQAWDLISQKIGGRLKESLDPFRKLHNIPPLSLGEQLEQSGHPAAKIPKKEKPRDEEMEKVAATLGIKAGVLDADVKDLAWLWESRLQEMEFLSPLSALDILEIIAHSYIRGRNCRMGNMQAIWKHSPTKAAVMHQVVRYVSGRNDNQEGEEWVSFPWLRKCGVTSVGGFFSEARRLHTERNLRQDEGERQEREEAKKTGQEKLKEPMDRLSKERGRGYDLLDEIRKLVDGEEKRDGH